MHLYFSRLRASLREGPDRKWLLPWGSSTDRAQRDVWKSNRAGWRKGAGWKLHLKRDLKWLQVGNEQVDSYTEPRRVLPHLAAGAASPGRYSGGAPEYLTYCLWALMKRARCWRCRERADGKRDAHAPGRGALWMFSSLLSICLQSTDIAMPTGRGCLNT